MRLSVASRCAFIHVRAICLGAGLAALGACGGGSGSGQPGGAGGSSGSGATAGATGGSSPPGGSGGGAGTATPAGTGGSSGAGTGGTSTVGTGGASNAGTGGAASGGTGGTSDARGGAGGARGGTSGNGGGGSAGAAGAGRGGSVGPGTGGMAGAASGGSGGTGSAACTRDLLRSAITAYFTALAAHSASTLPLADNVKFTENGKVMTLGDGLWKTAGALKYSQSALDVEICSSATHAVVPDGSMDIPVALRLRLVNQKIAEIETIAVRPGDYKLGTTTYASNTGAIVAANNTLMWESVPSGARNTRAELIAWIDKYFRMFPRGVCNTVSSCKRLENGGGSFNCSDASTSCAAGAPSGTPAMLPRILLADPDTGIGVGMTMFMGNTDMHMFKMYGGQVYAVHAILGGATSSGWD
jgi:hypothetical protein